MRLILLLLFLGIANYIFNQNINLDVKKIHKHFTAFESSKYICNFETSNFWYQEFISDTQHERPDSSEWDEVDPTGVMRALYHSHETYYDYPVVNINRADAENFCNWLTEKYNKNEKRKFKKVKFSLPTIEEWKNAAYNNIDKKAHFPFSKNPREIKDKKKGIKANFKWIPDYCLKEIDNKIINECEEETAIWINAQNYEGTIIVEGAQRDLTFPVNTFAQNKNICHLAGNVWEMTTSEIIGGSFNSTGYFICKHSESAPKLSIPHPEVGFRILMIVEEK